MNEQELHSAILAIDPDEIHKLDSFELLQAATEYMKFEEYPLVEQIATCFVERVITWKEATRLMGKTVKYRS